MALHDFMVLFERKIIYIFTFDGRFVFFFVLNLIVFLISDNVEEDSGSI